jgi:hypothetical protein
MDVRDDGDRAQVDDLPERAGVLGLRHGHPHHLAAGGGEARDLLDSRIDVVRVGKRHRLHDDGSAAADRDVAYLDLALARHP